MVRRPRLVVLALLAAALTCVGCGDAPDDDEAKPSQPETHQEQLDRLRALGYVGTTDELVGDEPPVAAFDAERVAPGLTLVSLPHLSTALLIDFDGAVVHRWEGTDDRAWGDVHLEPDGDLLVVGWGRREDDHTEELYVTRLAWDGEERWRRDLPAHHDVRRTTDGRLVTLTMGLRQEPDVDPDDPLKDNRVTFLDESGAVTGELSLYDALTRSDVVELRPVHARRPGVRQVDLLHANAVQVTPRVEASVPDALRPGQLLVTLRNQDLIVAVDPLEGVATWAWGRDELSGPHDGQLLANGNLLVFDNGLGRTWSRAVEVEPASGEIVWEFRADPPETFHTAICGAAQRLANGNTLLTDSDSGRVLEVTSAGDVVWEYRCPLADDEGRRVLVYRAERIAVGHLRDGLIAR